MEINPSLRFKGYTKVEPLLFGERFTKGEFMIKSIGTVHGVNVTIKGGNDLLLVELAALIRTIRKSL